MKIKPYKFLLFVAASSAVLASSVVACSSDDSGGGSDSGVDSGTDSTVDSSRDSALEDTGSDAGQPDSSPDSSPDADAALPSLCTTYKDDPVDGGTSIPPKRWAQIALDALLDAQDRCALGTLFNPYDNDVPFQSDCFYYELLEVAQCKTPGGVIYDYSLAQDSNGIDCKPAAAGDPRVLLGFFDPKNNGVTTKDITYWLSIVRKAAIGRGLAAADADRLVQALLARKAEAEAVASNNFSQIGNACDAGP